MIFAYLSAMCGRVATLADGKPISLSFLGIGSGLATVIITWGEYLNLLFKLAGGFFGAACTAAAFLFLLPRLLRFYRRWRTHGLEHADRE